MHQEPQQKTYDVVIIGGAMIGSAIAWFLSADPGFQGKVLVVERDPTYEWTSTVHTNSCIRQQFSASINIQISQFAVNFIRNLSDHITDDPELPEIRIHEFGYLYLASSPEFAKVLEENRALQNQHGVKTRTLSADELAEAFPFYNLDDIILGSHNPTNEGYFDGGTLFDCWRKSAKRNGVEYIHNEVISMAIANGGIDNIKLATGTEISPGVVVNATGPRAAVTAHMLGIDLPVEPRKRFTFIFDAAEPLESKLPLTIDPSGVHVRSDGRYYLCGCPPSLEDDVAVDPTDFEMNHTIWEEKVWPAIAHRIPAFERVKVINHWVGHYAYNTFDHNAILGPHPEIRNFHFANGFSGHGFQQSPAVGRGISELIIHNAYQTLDLTPLAFERIANNQPILEKAVI